MLKENYSIALLTCFFGKLPWYFAYFVHSCRYNPDVDFIVVTDDTESLIPLPSNVRLIQKTLDEVSQLAAEQLGMEVNITYGYKMCDFKPAYGVIFARLLSSYDFWGHTDLDIIFGNIRDFLSSELLENYDLISVRPDWLTGCFLVYRNIEKVNRLYEHSKDYRKVFTDERHYCFDETNFSHDDFSEGKAYYNIHTEVESMMHVVKKMEAAGYIKPHFDLFIIEGVPGKLHWHEGRLYYRKKYEVLLYHLIYLKKRYQRKRLKGVVPGHFRITPSRIIHSKPEHIYEI
ncbi:hypothetical protein SAMN05421821_1242 [Mucilaginibacter lappiensis]|uniref:Uncharacterized protein n=1 Tax=Mucilaginibacter lappiensis TaxID=354630 RepID=A0ABR6PSY0_9SPHI|nr:DUF6625 family protein [Mucilaginibacter lappiensis]MBB6112882.1 hypothetical protein [Mucilaginibacter lappiensis]SIS08842.1 hypothetical protein SAMN05421821_1242 [Mucilaginibacter lappiensis]